MRFKLLLIVFGFISTATMAQSQVPPGIDANRYVICMNGGFGSDYYAGPETYCRQWAGPSAAAAMAAEMHPIPPSPGEFPPPGEAFFGDVIAPGTPYADQILGAYLCHVSVTIFPIRGTGSFNQQGLVTVLASNMGSAVQSAEQKARAVLIDSRIGNVYVGCTYRAFQMQ